MSNLIQRTTEFAMHIVKAYVSPGDIVIDATCGNGHDTIQLAKMLGTPLAGRLYAFDIQEAAVSSTRQRLIQEGYEKTLANGSLIVKQLGHEHMAAFFHQIAGNAVSDGQMPHSLRKPDAPTDINFVDDLPAAASGCIPNDGLFTTDHRFHPADGSPAAASGCIPDDGLFTTGHRFHSADGSPAAASGCGLTDDHPAAASIFDPAKGLFTAAHGCGGLSSSGLVPGGFASAIVFNLGYLPGGDKNLTTRSDTTLLAVQQSLPLLKPDGLLSVTMYSGHPQGTAEKEALLHFAEGLDARIWQVSYVNMLNQKHNPPEILLISRKL